MKIKDRHRPIVILGSNTFDNPFFNDDMLPYAFLLSGQSDSLILVDASLECLNHIRLEMPHLSISCVNAAVFPSRLGNHLINNGVYLHSHGPKNECNFYGSYEQCIQLQQIERNTGKKATLVERVNVNILTPEIVAKWNPSLLIVDIEGNDVQFLFDFIGLGARPEILVYEHMHTQSHLVMNLDTLLLSLGYIRRVHPLSPDLNLLYILETD